jgi:hypothetical protein
VMGCEKRHENNAGTMKGAQTVCRQPAPRCTH